MVPAAVAACAAAMAWSHCFVALLVTVAQLLKTTALKSPSLRKMITFCVPATTGSCRLCLGQHLGGIAPLPAFGRDASRLQPGVPRSRRPPGRVAMHWPGARAVVVGRIQGGADLIFDVGRVVRRRVRLRGQGCEVGLYCVAMPGKIIRPALSSEVGIFFSTLWIEYMRTGTGRTGRRAPPCSRRPCRPSTRGVEHEHHVQRHRRCRPPWPRVAVEVSVMVGKPNALRKWSKPMPSASPWRRSRLCRCRSADLPSRYCTKPPRWCCRS